MKNRAQTTATPTNDRTQNDRPLISLCMIVKNEAKNLGVCLDDARQMADEMIVVDTGSADDTKAIAQERGARVFDFEWIDDFAAARNFSLSLAKGRYLLWLDGDDRIEKTAIERFIRFKSGLSQAEPAAYAIQVVCQGTFGERAVFYQVRLFPNRPDIRFSGKVHESLASSLEKAGLKVLKTDMEILHTGYDHFEEAQKKVARNLDLLKKGPVEGQHPADYHYHLAQCYVGLQDYGNCLLHLEKARALGPERPLYKESYAMLADCYRQTGQSHRAISALKKAVAQFPQSGQLHHLLGAALCLDNQNDDQYGEALYYLEKSRDLTVEIGSSPLPMDIDGRRQYFEARCLAGLGRLDEACRLFEEALKTVSNDPDVLRSYGLLRLKMGALDEAQAYLKQARAKSYRLDRRTWLASARLALYLKDFSQALDLYLEMIAADNNDVEGLVGLVSVSIRLGDIARLSFGLEKLADLVGLDSDIEIASPEQLADFVLKIGLRLKAAGDRDNHQILMEISRNSDFGAFFNKCPQPDSVPGQAAALP